MKTESDAIHPMTPEEIIARVDELKPKFLEGLAPEEVAPIVGAATLRRIPARTVITREGHDAEKLFLFLEGRGRTVRYDLRGRKGHSSRGLSGGDRRRKNSSARAYEVSGEYGDCGG